MGGTISPIRPALLLLLWVTAICAQFNPLLHLLQLCPRLLGQAGPHLGLEIVPDLLHLLPPEGRGAGEKCRCSKDKVHVKYVSTSLKKLHTRSNVAPTCLSA